MQWKFQAYGSNFDVLQGWFRPPDGKDEAVPERLIRNRRIGTMDDLAAILEQLSLIKAVEGGPALFSATASEFASDSRLLRGRDE